MCVLFFGSSSSTSAEDNSEWINLACHKNVIRAASSFFDRLFSENFTEESIVVEEGIEAMMVANNGEKQHVLQLTFHTISSHSIQSLVKFAYTGSVKLDSSILKKVVEDLHFMKMRSLLDILASRLKEELCYSNCIPNLIISHTLGKTEAYRKVLFFILDEFSQGVKRGPNFRTSWNNILKSELSARETSVHILPELKKEAEEIERVGLTEDGKLLEILMKVIETNSICKDEELRLLNFLVTKRREKCADHFENVMLYCYTDDEQLCAEYLADSHAQHHIEPINRAVCKKMAPQWQKVELELECIKQSSKDRISEWDQFSNLFRAEKSRDLEILEACAEIKPKMDKLSTIFKSGKVGPSDIDVLALKTFAAALREDSEQLKVSYEKAKRVSDELLSLLYKRSVSCASIVDTDIYELELLEEDWLEIDIREPLSTSNCISILKAAKHNEEQEVYNEAFHFLCVNFMDVVEESERNFNRRISLIVLEELLKSDKLKIESEDYAVLVVKEWLHFDIRHRKKFASQLLKQIRFGHVSKKVLEKFENDASYLVLLDDETKKRVEEACAGGYCTRNAREYALNTNLFVFGQDGVVLPYDYERNFYLEWTGENHGGEFGAVMVGKNVFIMGGFKDVNGSHQTLSSVSIYNVRTKVWIEGPSMIDKRCIFGACVSSDNTIYAIGGSNGNGYLSSVEMLKCNKRGKPIGVWEALPPISTARFGLEATVIDDKIYAVGGSNDPNRLPQMEVFNKELKVWKQSALVSQTNFEFTVDTVATFNKELYVFCTRGWCRKYSPVSDTWTAIATRPEPLCGYFSYLGSAVLQGKIYLVGGYQCTRTDIYDPMTNTWSQGAKLPWDVGATKCVAWN